MTDEYDMDASMEVADQIRGNQPGRINTPERKEARARARVAAEAAAAKVRRLGLTTNQAINMDDPDFGIAADPISYPLAAQHELARAAGLKVPGLLARLWARILKVFGVR
jgi:hypothetical protein